MIPVTDIIPTRTAPVVTVGSIVLSILFSAIVVHGSISVLVIHMLYLWLFGRTVEDRVGHLRFASLLLLCGAAAWMVSTSAGAVPGGLAGVIGAYFALYPHSVVLVLVPVPLLLLEIPAFVFLGFWLLLEILVRPVWPQVVMLFAGALLCLVLRRPERVRVEWWSP